MAEEKSTKRRNKLDGQKEISFKMISEETSLRLKTFIGFFPTLNIRADRNDISASGIEVIANCPNFENFGNIIFNITYGKDDGENKAGSQTAYTSTIKYTNVENLENHFKKFVEKIKDHYLNQGRDKLFFEAMIDSINNPKD